MKKARIPVVLFLILILGFGFAVFTGCENSNQNNEYSYIELEGKRVEDYFLLTKSFIESGSAAQGSYRWASYQYVLTGVLNGFYEDCIVYYTVGTNDKEHSVNINVGGSAAFNFTIVNGADIKFKRMTGKLYL